MQEKMLVKICGLTNLDDARAALDLGADFLGFILYEKSARYIPWTRLRQIQDKLPASARSVGIFVNAPRKKVLKIAEECGLYAIQIHGRELPEEFAAVPLPVWRAVFFRHGRPDPFPETWEAERYLIDASAEGNYGGTGIVADWTKAAEFCRKWPAMLAGGLTVENIAAAIRRVRPLGVDVASGVEQEPGQKNHRKMELFIRLAKDFSNEREGK